MKSIFAAVLSTIKVPRVAQNRRGRYHGNGHGCMASNSQSQYHVRALPMDIQVGGNEPMSSPVGGSKPVAVTCHHLRRCCEGRCKKIKWHSEEEDRTV